MGSGISTMDVPEKIDEDACRELAYNMTGDINAFDPEAFKILADVSGCLKKTKLIRWTEPLNEVDQKYFHEHLGCQDRIDFLKKFKPVIANEGDSGLKARLRLKGAYLTIVTSESLLHQHRVLPEWVEFWLEKKGFVTYALRGPYVIANGLLVTPIGEASKDGDLALCRWLFNHGADPDSYAGNNYNGNTPMLLACFEGHLHVCKWLNKDLTNKNVMQPNHDGHSPLIIAAMQGDYFLCQWLYDQHIRTNQHPMKLIRHRDAEGYTPLSWAVRNSQERVARWLIMKGALHNGMPSKEGKLIESHNMGHIDINLVKRDLFPPHPRPPVTSTIRRNLIRWCSSANYYHDIFTKLVVASFGTFKFYRKKRSYLYIFGGPYAKSSWMKIAEFAGIFYGRMLRDAKELKVALTRCEKEYVEVMKKKKKKGIALPSTFPEDTDSDSDDSDDDE